MKLLANLRTKSEKNAEYLIHAFLKAFNPTNSILIRGEEVTIELELDELSPEVFADVSSAIGHCEIVLLRYGTVSETEAASQTEVGEEETGKEEEEHSPSAATLTEAASKTEEQVGEEETSMEAEEHSPSAATLTEAASQTEEQVGEEETGKEAEDNSLNASTVTEPTEQTDEASADSDSEASEAPSTYFEKEELIQKLDELAKYSMSYGIFLKNVMSILNFNKRNSLFLVNVLRVTGDIDKIRWSTINEKLSEIGVKTSRYDVQKLKSQIGKYTNMRVIDFIKLIEMYKSKFSTQTDSNTEETTNNSKEAEESAKMPEPLPKESDSQEEVVSQEVASQEVASQEVASQEVASQEVASQEVASQEVVSQDVAEILKDSIIERRLNLLNRREELSSRIVKILDCMGWSSLNGTDQYVVLSIWQVAMKLKDITFAKIFESPKLLGFNQEEYVAIFYNFINRHMKRIGIKEGIDPIAFLKYSQKHILTEKERQTL